MSRFGFFVLALGFFLLSFGLFVLGLLPEDVLELVKQIRVLIVQATSYGKVSPSHSRAQGEHPNCRMWPRHWLALYPPIYLESEFPSDASRSAAATRSS